MWYIAATCGCACVQSRDGCSKRRLQVVLESFHEHCEKSFFVNGHVRQMPFACRSAFSLRRSMAFLVLLGSFRPQKNQQLTGQTFYSCYKACVGTVLMATGHPVEFRRTRAVQQRILRELSSMQCTLRTRRSWLPWYLCPYFLTHPDATQKSPPHHHLAQHLSQ